MSLCMKKIDWYWTLSIWWCSKREAILDCWLLNLFRKNYSESSGKNLGRDTICWWFLTCSPASSHPISTPGISVYCTLSFYEIALYFWIFKFQAFHVCNIKAVQNVLISQLMILGIPEVSILAHSLLVLPIFYQ